MLDYCPVYLPALTGECGTGSQGFVPLRTGMHMPSYLFELENAQQQRLAAASATSPSVTATRATEVNSRPPFRVAWVAIIGDSLSRSVFVSAVHAMSLVNEKLKFDKTTYHSDHVVLCSLVASIIDASTPRPAFDNGGSGGVLDGCRLLMLPANGTTLSELVEACAMP